MSPDKWSVRKKSSVSNPAWVAKGREEKNGDLKNKIKKETEWGKGARIKSIGSAGVTYKLKSSFLCF